MHTNTRIYKYRNWGVPNVFWRLTLHPVLKNWRPSPGIQNKRSDKMYSAFFRIVSTVFEETSLYAQKRTGQMLSCRSRTRCRSPHLQDPRACSNKVRRTSHYHRHRYYHYPRYLLLLLLLLISLLLLRENARVPLDRPLFEPWVVIECSIYYPLVRRPPGLGTETSRHRVFNLNCVYLTNHLYHHHAQYTYPRSGSGRKGRWFTRVFFRSLWKTPPE